MVSAFIYLFIPVRFFEVKVGIIANVFFSNKNEAKLRHTHTYTHRYTYTNIRLK